MPVIQRKGAQSSQGFGEFTQGAGVNPNQFIENLFSTYLYTGKGSTEIFSSGVALSSNASPWTTNSLTFSGLNSGSSVTSDSSGNYYVCGFYGSTYRGFLAKYNSFGVLQWQKVITSSINYINRIAVDSSGNVYVTASSGNSIYLIKYNSTGTIQWQRNLSDSNASGYNNNSLCIDSSGNIYITGALSVSKYIALAKYNSSGTLQWQRKITVSGDSFQDLGGVVVDSNNNVYVSYTTASTIKNYILKYNSAGVLQWQRMLSANQVQGISIAIDSNNNVCITGYYISGQSVAFVAQYNSSGVLQWQRSLAWAATNSISSNSISVDNNNNIYIGGYFGSPPLGFVAKYNSSGAIQWQRQISTNNIFGGYINAINADSNNNVYITGQIPTSYDFVFVTKFAQDGTSTSGTAIMNMAAANLLTDAAGTMTDAAGTATDAAGTATDAAGTATDAAGSATTNFATQPVVVSTGGMIWIKDRTTAYNNNLFDTAQGATKLLHSNTTDATSTDSVSLTSFNASGFSLGSGNTTGSQVNTSADNFVSWSFKKQAKFFDVVTYTGTGANRTISHNLGSTPGCIIVKRTDTTSNWQVYHSGLTSAAYSIQLNLTNAQASTPTVWNSTAPTSSVFSVGTSTDVNASGGTYVAYLYASNAGGFGSDGTQNVITCGSFTTDGSGSATINLGYEPQWVLVKSTNNSPNNWVILDNMRGWPNTGSFSGNKSLYANTSGAEASGSGGAANCPTATGFNFYAAFGGPAAASDNIYIAIRRGPMATPTVGTSVFSPIAVSSSVSYNTAETTNFVIDTQLATARGGYTNNSAASSRLTSVSTTSGNAGTSTPYLVTSGTAAESTTAVLTNGWNNTGFYIPASLDITSSIYWSFRRSPGFFDEVCYTGTGANTTQTHNLGVIPELIIIKERSASNDWQVYSSSLGNTKYLVLNTTAAAATGATRWNSTTPTSSVFSIGTDTTVNASTQTYVAYLFATCLGVSKVGSYTGTGATQTINCGFTGGARFVMIKRTDSTGDWYVWDTARGMVAGTDPYLLFNTTAAEVNANNVYTTGVGFQIVGTGAGINASGGTYIYLAIA